MRATSVAFLVAALAGCYNTGDLGDRPFKCIPDTAPECPDGYTCNPMTSYCERANGASTLSVSIDKGGASLSCNPMGVAMPCSETDANSNLSTAESIGSGLLSGRQICPGGDVDVYQGSASNQLVKVEICYGACGTDGTGDLDIAILDNSGTMLASDGSARSNGCAITTSPVSGTYYVAVVGANGNTGNYSIKATACNAGSGGCSCPSGGLSSCP